MKKKTNFYTAGEETAKTVAFWSGVVMMVSFFIGGGIALAHDFHDRREIKKNRENNNT